MTTIRLDHSAIEDMLKNDMRGPIDELATTIAGNVSTGSVDAQVTVKSYTTDRAAAAVTIAHPAGLAIEAKYGALKKAAAAEGLEVTAK